MSTKVAVIKEQEGFEAQDLVWYGLGGAILMGVGFLGWRLLRSRLRAYRGRKVDETAAREPTSPEALAIRVRQAFNPSGISWMIDMDGTDEEALYDLAREVPSRQQWVKVADAYRRKFNASMLDDLNSELDSEELAKLMQILQTKPLNGPDDQLLLYAQTAAPVYSLQEQQVGLAKRGLALGVYIGQQNDWLIFRTKTGQLRKVNAKAASILID